MIRCKKGVYERQSFSEVNTEIARRSHMATGKVKALCREAKWKTVRRILFGKHSSPGTAQIHMSCISQEVNAKLHTEAATTATAFVGEELN